MDYTSEYARTITNKDSHQFECLMQFGSMDNYHREY